MLIMCGNCWISYTLHCCSMPDICLLNINNTVLSLFTECRKLFFSHIFLIGTIRYDTVDLRALKSWRDGQLNLAHGPETKNNEKNENQKKRVAQKKRCRQKSVEAVREEEVKLRGVRFVKEVGFKPGVKERWNYRYTKWWIRRGRSDGWGNRWAGDGGTGARMRFTKRQRELIAETWREHRIGVIWHDLGAFMTVQAREFWICWRRDNWDLGSL